MLQTFGRFAIKTKAYETKTLTLLRRYLGIRMSENNNKRSKFSPDKIGVIICGYPNPESLEVAKACVKRGYKVAKFGLTTGDAKEIEVPDVGKVALTKFSAKDSKEKLDSAIKEAQKEGYFPVVADTTHEGGNVSVYNELQVPFVLQSGSEKIIKDTEQAKTFALISEDLNKRMAAFDAIWADWGKRFPGLLSDHDFVGKATNPERAPKSIFNTFSDLFNQNISEGSVEKIGPSEQKKMGITEGSVTKNYTFKNGSGTSTFTFSHTSNNNEGYAEGVADSIAFLAQKAQQVARPKVYGILDVAEQGRLPWF